MPFKFYGDNPALASLHKGAARATRAAGNEALFEAEINGQVWQATAVTLLEPQETGGNYYTLVGGTFASGHAPATVLTLSLQTIAQPGFYQFIAPELLACKLAWPVASGWYINDLQAKPAVFDFICGQVHLAVLNGGKIGGSFECLAMPQNDPGQALAIKKGRFVIAGASSKPGAL